MSDNMTADPARSDELIVVDGLDRELRVETKETVHRQGLLHRAFSVVLVREGSSGPELLLSKRAAGKYHSGGLWANSCCSHPRTGEALVEAACRRVREELGCEAIELEELAAFVYRAEFDDGLVEYEYDHVIVGTCEGDIDPQPSEVADVRWVGADEVAAELAAHPEHFAAWAFTVLSIVLKELCKTAYVARNPSPSASLRAFPASHSQGSHQGSRDENTD